MFGLCLLVGSGVLSYCYKDEIFKFYEKMREGVGTYTNYYTNNQKKRNSEIVKSKSTAKLSYSHDGEEYTIVFPLRRGPSVILSAWTFDEDGEKTMVTDELIKFAGPSRNFHGIPTTPLMLGWDNGVYYQKLNSEMLFFDKNDDIYL